MWLEVDVYECLETGLWLWCIVSKFTAPKNGVPARRSENEGKMKLMEFDMAEVAVLVNIEA